MAPSAVEASFVEPAKLAAAADELISSRPDLLLVGGEAPAVTLARKTRTIPIVFAVVQDPIEGKLVASLKRPGGNVTGLTSLARDLGPKRLELLKEFPRVTRVGLLFQPSVRASNSQAKVIVAAAERLGMRIVLLGVNQAADIEAALQSGPAAGAQAYMVAQSALIISNTRAISDHVARLRVPSVFASVQAAEAGALISYSASFTENFRRAAGYADRILKGAKPGDLPIEQPTKFELVVNLKTAKALGLTIPQSILLRADRVIE